MSESPRLKTEIWVQAFLRACAGRGLYGAVIHKGALEAGALYVAVNHLDGTYDLLSPPPGPAHNTAGERHFGKAFPTPTQWPEISDYIARRRRVDPDLWLIEVEDKTGLAGLQQVVD